MWKTFEYSGKQRVAFLPPQGPAFQVRLDDEYSISR